MLTCETDSGPICLLNTDANHATIFVSINCCLEAALAFREHLIELILMNKLFLEARACYEGVPYTLARGGHDTYMYREALFGCLLIM